jgi:hypothetical protein
MANKDIVKIDGASFDAMLERLTEIIKSRPVAERWTDFLEFSSNVIITELIAAGMSFNNYESKVALREAFLHISTRLSSKIGVAETLGYSVNRGQNRRLRLTIEPSISISIPALSVIGLCKEVDLVNIDPIILNTDQVQDIDVTVGRLFEEELKYATNKPTRMRFMTEGVSEDVRLYVNGVDTSFSKEILEMTDDMFCMLTNHLQSVDVLYLNEAGNIKAGDVLTIRFVKREDLVYNYTDIKFDYGKIKKIKQIMGDQSVETLDQIEYNAPISHEVQKVVRGRRDYHQYLPALNSDIISSNYMDITPAVIAISYLKKDETFFNREEKDALLLRLMERRPFGVEPPKDLIDPIVVDLKLLVTITLMSFEIPPTMNGDIKKLFDIYDKSLAARIDFKDAEKMVESSLEYVKIARVTIDAPIWENRQYKTGDFIRDSRTNLYYKARIIQRTGSVEPDWPLEEDVEVIDGRVIWKSYLAYKPAKDWRPNFEYYYILSTVKKVESGTSSEINYECVNFVNKTGDVEPDWSLEVGSLYFDNDIVWELRAFRDPEYADSWQADTQTEIGDQVNVLEYVLKAVCIGHCRKGLGTEPEWPTTTGYWVDDGELEWMCMGADVKPQKLDWNQYFSLDIGVVLENDT